MGVFIAFTLVWRKGFSGRSSTGSNRDTVQTLPSNLSSPHSIRMEQFVNKGYNWKENIVEFGFVNDLVPAIEYFIKLVENSERFLDEEKVIVRNKIIQLYL